MVQEMGCQEGAAGYEIATFPWVRTNNPTLWLVIPFHFPSAMLWAETLEQQGQKVICCEAPMPESHSNSTQNNCDMDLLGGGRMTTPELHTSAVL